MRADGAANRWRALLAKVYKGMQTQAQEVVERYDGAFDAHRNDWQDLVTDDVVFEGRYSMRVARPSSSS